MRILTCLALPIFILFAGCASISKTLSDNASDDYDFRKTRWGDSRQRVLRIEKDMQIYQQTDDLLIYRTNIAGVPALLVYTFKDNKLRAAGYITEKPAKNAQNITKLCIEEHGQPTEKLNKGMVWKTPETVVFANAYLSHLTLANPKFERTSDGLIADAIKNYTKLKSNSIQRWDSVWSYIDADFYNEQQSKAHFTDLSLYEKLLFGAIKRNENIHFSNNAGFSASFPPELIKLIGIDED